MHARSPARTSACVCVERLERRHAAYAVLAEYVRRALLMMVAAVDRCFPTKEKRDG